MAHPKLTDRMDARNQVLIAPDTEIELVLLEGLRLLDFDADIYKYIGMGVDRAAKESKKSRILDRQWEVEQTPALFQDGVVTLAELRALDADSLRLGTGRARLLDAEAVFVLLVCCGWLDSVSSEAAQDRLRDSLTIEAYLTARGMRLPQRSCLREYVAMISPATRNYIHEAQIRYVMSQGLDEMTNVTIDSFSVSANTAWPTDSDLVLKLLRRALLVGSRMQEQFGVPGFTEGWIQEWLSQIKSLGFRISCAAGKPNATATVRSLYRQLLELAGKSIERLSTQLRTLQPLWAQQRYPPSVQSQFDKAVGTVFDCLGQAVCICQYAERRIEEGVNLPASEKILSVSDRTAAFIKKGGREPVIGYKPQVLRTATGFITVAELCEGNPNDSTRFVPVVQTHIALTGVTPTVASSDDGYSTAEVRDTLLGMQVEIVSMSGSKGKRLTGEEEWEGPAYQTARRQRSAVESSIWVLRCKFSLYRFSRCGIDAVRAELQERVLVYNLWRAALLRRRRAEEPAADQAA